MQNNVFNEAVVIEIETKFSIFQAIDCQCCTLYFRLFRHLFVVYIYSWKLKCSNVSDKRQKNLFPIFKWNWDLYKYSNSSADNIQGDCNVATSRIWIVIIVNSSCINVWLFDYAASEWGEFFVCSFFHDNERLFSARIRAMFVDRQLCVKW